MANKGLLAVLLAAGLYLAGAAVSFCCIQTAMIASGAGDSSSSAATTTTPAGCEPAGFRRLPVSLEVMKSIDAAVFVAAAAAWIPADAAIDSMPFPFRRAVRNLAKSAFSFGVLAPYAALPTCPAEAPPAAAAAGGGSSSPPAGAGAAGCGSPCSTFFSRAARRRVNVGGIVALAVASILLYLNLATWTRPRED